MGPDEFEKVFDGMFSMIDFDNKLSSLKVQYLAEHVIGYSKDEYVVKVQHMVTVFGAIKFKKTFRHLQQNNPSFINSIDLKTNFQLYKRRFL